MTLTRNAIAICATALLISGLMTSRASAAVKWSDISTVTHNASSETALPHVGGPKPFNRTDVSAVTHRSAPSAVLPVGRSGKNHSRNDITAVTHNQGPVDTG